MKRIISVVLSIVMLFSVAGVAAAAQEPKGAIQPMASDDALNDLLGSLKSGLDFFRVGINDSEIYLRPTDNPDIHDICIRFKENDGDVQDNFLGIKYNSKTGECYDVNYDRGILGTGFNYNAITKVFYAMNDCWHKAFGFTPLYDLLAFFAFDYTTSRIFFDYAGKEWMIQLWKGNYIFDLFVGGEVGIYNRPADSTIGFKYNCVADDEILPMSIKVYDENRVYFDRGATPCWWATGFVIADKVEPKSLTMESSIEFPNQEMCDAFAAAAAKKRGVNCEVKGTTAYIVW